MVRVVWVKLQPAGRVSVAVVAGLSAVRVMRKSSSFSASVSALMVMLRLPVVAAAAMLPETAPMSLLSLLETVA